MAAKFFKNRFQIKTYGEVSEIKRDGIRLQRKLDGSLDIFAFPVGGKTAKIVRFYPHRRDEDNNPLPTPVSEMLFGVETKVKFDSISGVVREPSGKALKVAKGQTAVLLSVNTLKIPVYGRIVGVAKENGYRQNLWVWFVLPTEEVLAYKEATGVDITAIGTRVKVFNAHESEKMVGAVTTGETDFAAALPKVKAAKGKPVSQTAKPMAKKAAKVAKTETVGVSL